MISKRLGHASVSFTYDKYGHLMPRPIPTRRQRWQRWWTERWAGTTESGRDPEKVSQILQALVNLDPERLRGVGPATADEVAAAEDFFLAHIEFSADRGDRVAPVYEVAAPYLKAGAKTWAEAVERMSDVDVDRLLEALQGLQPGDLAGS